MQPSPVKILLGSKNHFKMEMQRALTLKGKERINLNLFIPLGVAKKGFMKALEED